MMKPLRYYSSGRHNEEGGTNVKSKFGDDKVIYTPRGGIQGSLLQMGKIHLKLEKVVVKNQRNKKICYHTWNGSTN